MTILSHPFKIRICFQKSFWVYCLEVGIYFLKIWSSKMWLGLHNLSQNAAKKLCINKTKMSSQKWIFWCVLERWVKSKGSGKSPPCEIPIHVLQRPGQKQLETIYTSRCSFLKKCFWVKLVLSFQWVLFAWNLLCLHHFEADCLPWTWRILKDTTFVW